MKKQAKKHGKRYCKVCQNPLQKRGKNRGGTQRWFCPVCNISTTGANPIPGIVSKVTSFLDWALSKKTVSETAKNISRKTFYNYAKEVLRIVPFIPWDGEIYNCILVDSTCIKKYGLMVLKTPQYVISFHWTRSENKDDYILLFSPFPAPNFVVTDGHASIEAACKKVWKTVKIQRCLVHIDRFVRNHIGVRPVEPAKIAIRKLSRKLFGINTIKKAENWTRKFWSEYKKYEALIDAEKPRKKYNHGATYYINRGIHDAWRHVRRALEKGQLFTFLEDNSLDEKHKCVRDTNSLEGGINARVKELCRCHRGTTPLLERRIIEWYLVSRSATKIEDIIKAITTQKPPHFYT